MSSGVSAFGSMMIRIVAFTSSLGADGSCADAADAPTAMATSTSQFMRRCCPPISLPRCHPAAAAA
jgi:hypothetical protein